VCCGNRLSCAAVELARRLGATAGTELHSQPENDWMKWQNEYDDMIADKDTFIHNSALNDPFRLEPCSLLTLPTMAKKVDVDWAAFRALVVSGMSIREVDRADSFS